MFLASISIASPQVPVQDSACNLWAKRLTRILLIYPFHAVRPSIPRLFCTYIDIYVTSCYIHPSMDVNLFDPQAPRVFKQTLVDFLKHNESTIHLRTSLTKAKLIELVDDQKSQLGLHRTCTLVIGTHTLRHSSTPNLPPVAGNTTCNNPCRILTPRLPHVAHEQVNLTRGKQD